ncbi:MAG TPA: hypothetical protein VGC60_01970, partial [Pyrinomonadaceae bacterium]
MYFATNPFQDCGFAAAQCGKALPYRQLCFSFAARLSLAAVSQKHRQNGKPKAFRSVLRQSRQTERRQL